MEEKQPTSTLTVDPKPKTSAQSRGLDELNLSRFPISTLRWQQPVQKDGTLVTTKVYKSKRWDSNIKGWVPQTVTLMSNSELGLPTHADENILIALIQQAHGKKLTDPKIRFVPNQLIKTLRWSGNKREYQRLHDGLARLQALSVTWKNAWYNRDLDEYEEVFATSVIAEYQIYKIQRGRSGRRPKDVSANFATLGPRLFEHLRDGIINRLDLDTYFSLKLPVSQRTYRFLNGWFWKSRITYEGDLADFASHIGMTIPPKIPKLKQNMQGMLSELASIGFIEDADTQHRFHKVKKGVWRISIRKRLKSTRKPTKATTIAMRSPLHDELTKRGVSFGVATQLITSHPAEKITEKIELLDWKTRTDTQPTPNNPAGWLNRAINEDYSLPDGFESSSQKAAKSERLRQAEERRQKADSARRHKEDAARAAKNQRIIEYLESLGDGRQQFEEDAIATHANRLDRKMMKNDDPQLAESARLNVIGKAVLPLISQPAE